jgi:hypothetical protein
VDVARRVAPLVGLLGGCGSQVPGTPVTSSGPPPDQVVDPCTVLTDAQLRELGVRPESRRVVSELDAHGCGWLGDPFGFSLTTDPDTVAGTHRSSTVSGTTRSTAVQECSS